MSDSPFNFEEMQRAMESTGHGNSECVEYCRLALEGFNATAKQLHTPVVEVEISSLAVQAAGIAMGSWPVTDGKTRYYRLLVNRQFADIVWVGGDGQGLTQTESGQYYFEGSAATVHAIAAKVSAMCGHDSTQARAVFEAALRGEALSFG